MKVGVIGTGTMGKNHVRVYPEFKAVEEIYVFDAIVCDSVEELLNNPDAVSLCVPTKYHFEVAKKVIEKVLVNKIEPLKVGLKTFVDCVIKGKEFPITPEQAFKNLRICEEIKNACKIL